MEMDMVPSPLVVIEPESEALAAEDVEADSQEPDEVVPESQMPPDSITLSWPDSVDMVPDFDEMVPNSVDAVPDSLPPGAFVCGSCGDVHEDREAWNRRHSRLYSCGLCGLIREDYAMSAVLGLVDKTIVTTLANCERCSDPPSEACRG
jgi:hypothetical protein